MTPTLQWKMATRKCRTINCDRPAGFESEFCIDCQDYVAFTLPPSAENYQEAHAEEAEGD